MEKLPKFKTAKEEAEFWETHSPLEFPGEFEEVKEPIVDRRGRKKGIYIRVDPQAIAAGEEDRRGSWHRISDSVPHVDHGRTE